ncbi:hypothetical protein OSTOST_01214, partial [Ostertagia ostertagi]
MHCYGHTLFSLVVSFAYRYYVLVHEKPKRFTIIFIVITVYLPSFLAFILFCFGTDSEDQVKLVIHSNIGYDLSSECVRGHVNILKWETLIPVLYIVLPVVPIYTAILILKSMTVSKLVVTRGMSQYTRTLHTQLLRVGTHRASLPTCLLSSRGCNVWDKSAQHISPSISRTLDLFYVRSSSDTEPSDVAVFHSTLPYMDTKEIVEEFLRFIDEQ